MMRGVAVAIGCVVALAATRARAQPEPAPQIGPRFNVPEGAVRWRAPEECGDGSELRRRIAGYLDHPISDALFASVEVVRTDDDTYRAHLEIHATGGVAERTVEARDCAQVVDAIALVLGMAAATPDAARPALPPDDRGAIDHRVATPLPPPTLSLRVRGAGEVGAIPGGGLGVGGGLAFTRGRYALVGSVDWFPRRFASLGTDHAAGVEVGLRDVAAEGCVRVTGVWLCLGGGGGAMTGDGVDVSGAHGNTSSWADVTAAVAVEQRMTDRIRFVAELAGYTAVLRTRFVLDDAKQTPPTETVLYEPARIGARLYAGFEITLF